MDVQSIILIVLFAVILIMIFSAVEFLISLFARSIKEAQIIFIPVLMTAIACGYGAVFFDPKNISLNLFNFPILNICLTIKQLTLDIINWFGILNSLFWSIFKT